MSNRILRLSWLLLVFAIAVPTMAQQVSEQAALEKARAFFQKPVTASGQTIRRAPRKAPRLKAAVAGSEYYIFNDEANQDFVIISGDERTPDILGYSDEGCYNTQDVPEGLAELLDGYAEEIRAIQAGTASPRRAPANEFDAIKPLLTSSWAQYSPYNLMCPLQNGSHCLTGCVATAMAQVMYYHKWPKTLPVDIPAHPYRDDLPAIPAGTAFDWESMLDSYDSNATTTQQNAVALLMLACGQAVHASYGLNATSASTFEVLNALRNYMGYNGYNYVTRNSYRSSDWDQLIYDELKGGRPVCYRGEHASVGGHAFVCDGYSSDRLFHFNFGWNGGSNGYYLLALSEPGAGTSFSGGQAALIGVQPNNLPEVTPTVQPSEESGSYQNLTINSWTLPSAFERDRTADVNLSITNNGDIFFRNLSLISALGSPVSAKGDFDAGETREDTYSFTPMRSGKTRFLLASDNSGTEVVGQSDEFEIALGKEEVCYLYNPAADLYFCAGNLYGTHASLGEAGLDVALIGSKNTYKIETQVCNTGVKHYLGKDFYVDQEAAQWTFTYGDDGTFSMSIDGKNYLAYDGSSRDLTTTTNPNATGARWQKRSREEIITLMKQATQSKPVDATCLIGGGDFGRADRRGLQWADGTLGTGYDPNCHAEKSGHAFDTYRVIEGLPNGTYKVRVQAFYREDQPANTATLYQSGQHHLYSVFYANNVSTPVQSIFAEAGKRDEGISTSAGVVPYYSSHVSTWFSDNLYWNELTVTVTDGTLRLGIRNSQSLADDWTCFDSFRLTYYGNGTTPTPASYTITTTAYPTDGGYVTGQGTYKEGQTVVLKATPTEGNTFRGWEENGKIVSDSETYSFVASASRQLQAVFIDPIFQGFSNTKLYTLTCQRDELVPDANGLTLATGQTRPDATAAEKQFAIITVHGAHYLYSPHYKKYVASFGYLHDDLGDPIKFDDSHADGDYKYMLSFIYNDLTYYINCRSNGEIVYNSYNTPDAGNLWKIEEVGDFDPTDALAVAEQWSDVTFEVEFNGAVIATEKTTVKTGNAMPSVPTSLASDFLTLTPVGTVPTTVTQDVTVRYNATWTGPFRFTTSMTDATWYNMNIRSGYWVGKQDTEPYYPSQVDEATLRQPEYQWAFGGDPYHVKVYNRSTRLQETLTNDGENVVMREGDDSWDLLPNSDGFVLRKTGTTYKCINQNGGKTGPLQFWNNNNSLTDDGSTFRVEEATECDMPGLASGYYRIRTGMTYTNDNQVRDKYLMSHKQDDKYWAIWGTPADFTEATRDIRPLFKITNMGDETYDIASAMYDTRFTNITKSTSVEMTTESTNLMAIDEAGTLDDVTYYDIRVATQDPSDYIYLHQNSHKSGQGTSGFIVGWCTTFNETTGIGASEWLFKKVDDSEAKAIIATWQPYLEHEKALRTYRTLYAQAEQEIEAMKEKANRPLITDITQLTSPCSDNEEGVGEHGLQVLIDGITSADDSNNFWHSDWHGSFTTETNQYLQVELAETLTEPVFMQFSRRKVAYDHITKWSVYGTDVNDFQLTQASGQLELLAEFDTPYKSNTETIQTDYFDTKGYKYLRFYCENGTRGNRFFHLSEFNVYLSEYNSDSQYTLIGQPAITLDNILTSQKNLADDDVTQADIDEFTNAYNAFIAALPQTGDLDCNGQIDADDVRFLTNVIIIPHCAFKPSADLNSDSRISIADLTELIRLLR